MVAAMEALDSERIRNSEKSISDFERKARQQKRHLKKKLEDQFDDNSDYETGMY